MLQRCLEAIFAGDTLAFPFTDVGKSLLSHLFKLSEDVGQQLVLLLLSQCASRFAFHFGQSITRPLHTMNAQRARNKRFCLRLPYLSEKENLSSALLFVRINPEELKTTITFERKSQVLVLKRRIDIGSA